jgi:hypothetical protein
VVLGLTQFDGVHVLNRRQARRPACDGKGGVQADQRAAQRLPVGAACGSGRGVRLPCAALRVAALRRRVVGLRRVAAPRRLEARTLATRTRRRRW